MWNIPSAERLAKIPRLYETESTPPAEKEIHLHFFMGGCDWFIAEFDGIDTFFGFALLNGDVQNSEWGYISFQELKDLKISFMEVDCELEEFWTIKKASLIDKIKIHDR